MKQDKIRDSIENRFLLLADIIKHPKKYIDNEVLTTALITQGNYCKLKATITTDTLNIILQPLSLNTLKKWLSDKGPGEDFEHFNKLRIRALQSINAQPDNSIEHAQAPTNRSRSALENKIKKLESTISELHAANMILIQALDVNRRDLITISRTNGNGDRQQRIEKSINRIIKILSLNPAPYDDVSLLTIKPTLKVIENEKKTR